jgi:hypothetical protein
LSTAEWRFTDDQGVEQVVGTDDLKQALSSGKLPPSTLVWRTGMKEWAPAFTLAELSGAAIAAGRVSRASVPPVEAYRPPMPTPPPVPIPLGTPRGPLHTLTGLEPPEIAASLGMGALPGEKPSGAELGANIPDDRTDDPWNDVTDLIPKAPGVPRDAPKMVPPRVRRSAPSLPPPPLPATPTPPPEAPAAKPAERRPTLTGTGQRPAPAPPPRPKSIPPRPNAETTGSGTGSPTSKQRSIPPGPPPRRLNKTLEMDASARAKAEISQSSPSIRRSTPPPLNRKPSIPPGGLPAAIAQAKPLVSASTPPPGAAAPSVTGAGVPGGPSVPRISPQRPTALGLGKRPLPREEPDDPPTAIKATSREVAPTPNATSPSTPAPSTTTTTISTTHPAAPQPAATPAPAAAAPRAGAAPKGGRERTEPVSGSKALDDARAAFAAELKKPEPAKEAEPVPRSRTMEMAVGDHQNAAAKDPAPPESRPEKLPATDGGTARMPLSELNRADEGPESRAPASTAPVSTAAVSTPRRPAGPRPSTPPRDESPSAKKKRRKKDALEVPLSSLLAASGVWVVGLVAFFFVGRASGFKTGGAPIARDGIADSFLAWETPSALAPAETATGPLPCWVTRQPARWVPSASKSVPFEMRPAGETGMEVGVAVGDREGVGLRVDLRSGKLDEVYRKKSEADIVRVVPTGQGEGFYVSEAADRQYLPVGADTSLALAFEKGQIGIADATGGDPTKLWALDGDDEVTAAIVTAAGPSFLLTFRRGSDVYGGYFDKQKQAVTPLSIVKGSGGKTGKPRAGFNGSEVAVTFADKPDEENAGYEIRLGRATVGSIPAETTVIPVPEGGPGKNAISPDVVGLSGGRWLLMWTEGKSGAWAIRAQTYDASMSPIGDPIALSPPAGSFGQAILGVAGNYTTAAFLQAQDEGFELWGAVLQCGF